MGQAQAKDGWGAAPRWGGLNHLILLSGTSSMHPLKQNRILPVDALAPHPRNYRKHPEAQIRQLMASLLRFGQGRSIIVQEGAPGQYLIVGGHGIVQAVQRINDDADISSLKFPELRADILPADWTPQQVEGYLLADNELSRNAEDDGVLLASMLQEQEDAGFDLETMGADKDFIQELLARAADDLLLDDQKTRTTELNEPKGGEVHSAFTVVIECEDEDEQKRAYELVDREGFRCKVLTL